MKRFALHVLLWAGYALVEYVANLPHYNDPQELVRQTLFFLPVIALPFYLIAYGLVPRLLWRGQKTLFWLSCALVFLLVMVVRLQWTNWYAWLNEGITFDLPLSKISKNLFRDYAVIGFAVALKVIRDWDKKDRLASRLQLEKRDAELQFLRAQIHPHFLFNTLNNLYGLALTQSPHTADSILRLSGLLDFMLYQCNAERIPVEKELELIGHYLELERLRFGRRLQLEFRHPKSETGALLAPLLLLPFVENAFKHGASQTNDAVFINIRLAVEQHTLHFRVENSKPRQRPAAVETSHGIGLQNIEKRLALLYPGHYQIQVRDAADTFTVDLKLDV
ncbi:MAG: sensor histidine kinase [Saprospiraceae bacterium]|nr:sensor histidine kinase [Saprospiraceae bacterium]